tara:strand:- start:10 stop:288 length:279 start_codon:yes stop_codon:yes gene_type:complete
MMVTKAEMGRIADKTRQLFGKKNLAKTPAERASRELHLFGSLVLSDLLRFNKIVAKKDIHPASYVQELIEFHRRVYEDAVNMAIVSEEEDNE